MIAIVDYDQAWPELYESERGAIVGALGGLVAGIEHIGSTAVPELAAKPIVDIMVGLVPGAELDACVGPLEGLGYCYVPRRERVMPFRRFFVKGPRERGTHHVHAVHLGHPFWVDHLAFRDYLRAHPETARAYAEHKRELAPRFTDTNDYAEAKTGFILAVLERARSGG